MTDRELLELAAKAAGKDIDPDRFDEDFGFAIKDMAKHWNPLEDDGDALRLAVKLRLEIGFPKENVVWSFGRTESDISKELNFTDPYAATRRAIVKAAAEIGRGNT